MNFSVIYLSLYYQYMSQKEVVKTAENVEIEMISISKSNGINAVDNTSNEDDDNVCISNLHTLSSFNNTVQSKQNKLEERRQKDQKIAEEDKFSMKRGEQAYSHA
jgi:hypothetical protein